MTEPDDVVDKLAVLVDEQKRTNVLLQQVLHQLQLNAARAQQLLDKPVPSEPK
jgi:hypothetical protein